MITITVIKIMMTLAMVFYAIGIYLGTKQRKLNLSRWVHVSFASVGFVLDMWATYKMEMLRTEGWTGLDMPVVLWSHTIVSTLAIVLFAVMVWLGYTGRIKWHRKVVWFAFIPMWLIAYISGIYLVFQS